MFKVTEVLGKIGKVGLARPSRFLMEFTGSVPIPSADANRRFAFMCYGLQIPSKSFQTAEIHQGSGPTYKIPYTKQINNRLDFHFYLGKDMFERLFFEVWQNKIQNPKSFNFAYQDTYQAEIRIYQLDESNNVLYATKLTNAYPESIGDLTYDSGTKNAVLTQTVSLGFRNAYYGIPMPRGQNPSTIRWEDEINPPEDFGDIDPQIDDERKSGTNYGRLIEAVASAGSVLLKKNRTPADWLSAGSILIGQGTEDYYNSLNLFNVILGNKPQTNDVPGAPVLTIPGI